MWLAAGFVVLFWATPQEMLVTYIQYLTYPAVVVTVYILDTSFIKCDLTEIKLDAGRSILLEVSVFSFLLDWLHICRPVLAHRWTVMRSVTLGFGLRTFPPWQGSHETAVTDGRSISGSHVNHSGLASSCVPAVFKGPQGQVFTWQPGQREERWMV